MADPLGLIADTQSTGHVLAKPQRADPGQEAQSGPAFKDVLMNQLNEVNRLQADAETAIEDLNAGRRDDVDQVMIAKQKADIAFQMLLQVRNKMMDAYEEVKQMRV